MSVETDKELRDLFRSILHLQSESQPGKPGRISLNIITEAGLEFTANVDSTMMDVLLSIAKAHETPPPENDEPDLDERLIRASIGSCSCLTKSPAIKAHDPLCHFRLFCECLDVIARPPYNIETDKDSI